jgi:hypothetical protein
MTFDPTQFLDTTTTDSNSTSLAPCPVGEYTASIDKISARQWQKKDDPNVAGVTLDIFWKIEDESVKQATGRDKVICKQGIMLDMNDDGGLDCSKGANVSLGRLREAIGLNVPGQPFSFNMLPGRMARVNVVHRPDPKDPEVIYAEVKAATKLA